MVFRRTSILLSFVVLLIIVLSSIAVEQFFFTANQRDIFKYTADSNADGLLAQESSDQLPGASAPISDTYYWTKPELLIHFWRTPALQRIITLRYYTPYGSVSVVTNDQVVTQIPPSTTIRVARFLTPADPQFDITFRANAPKKVDTRTVGMMFLDISWQAVWGNPYAVATSQIPALLVGIPTSIVLLAVLLWCIGTPLWAIPVGAIGYLLTLIIVYVASPWHATAIQPTIQFVVWMGLGGVGVSSLLRRANIALQTPYIILGAVWVLSTLLLFVPSISSDGVGYYAYIRSFGIDGDLQFINEFDKTLSPLPSIATFPIYAPTGYMINAWSVGPALIWAPFWYIAHGTTLLANLVGGQWPVDGYTLIYKALTTFSSSLAGLVTLYATYLFLTRWFSQSIALLSTITLYVGSNWLYYTQVAGSYPHSLTALFAILMVISSWKIIDLPIPRTRHWVYFGLSTGALILCYWMNILIGVYPLGIIIYKFLPVFRQKNWVLGRAYLYGVLISVVCGLAVLAPQFITWQYLYRSWFTVYIQNGRYTTMNFRFIPYLFGPLYGLLWWTPAYFVAILGSVWFAIKRPWPGVLFLLTIIIFISYNVGIPDWDGSGGFGFRRIMSLMPFFAIGLATILQALQRWRLLPVVLASIMAGWSIRIMVRYMEFKFFRAPDDFLDTLTASMLSESVMPRQALTHQITNSLFINQLLVPNWMGIIVCIILVTLTIGVFYYGRRILPKITTTHQPEH